MKFMREKIANFCFLDSINIVWCTTSTPCNTPPLFASSSGRHFIAILLRVGNENKGSDERKKFAKAKLGVELIKKVFNEIKNGKNNQREKSICCFENNWMALRSLGSRLPHFSFNHRPGNKLAKSRKKLPALRLPLLIHKFPSKTREKMSSTSG